MQFKDVIGQEDVKTRLIQSYKNNRVSHAQLFLGPEGSGNLPLALAYAQFISCTDKQENDSCGQCNSCVKYSKMAHPDLHLVYPIATSKEVKTSESLVEKWRNLFLENPYMSLFQWIEQLDAENKQVMIGSDESASILEKLSLTSYESSYKIMLIWMAEKMNVSAANKLLKILEEPTENTLFLLVCENEENLLRTIISRTQLIKIKRLSTDEICNALQKDEHLERPEAVRIALLADGNYNSALKFLREGSSNENNFSLFREWMRMCLKFNGVKVVEWNNQMAALGREEQKNFLHYVLHLLRECMMYSYTGTELMRTENEELAFVKNFSPFIHENNLEKFIDEINSACLQLERNANPKLLFTDLAFKINELLNIKKS
ncbi:MAG: DNA polymerase III subunit delta' [Bacteroidia bacterium]